MIRRAPDRITEFGAARFVSDTMVIDVRVSDLPDPHPGDLIVIGADLRARVLADLAARSDAAGIIATAPAAAAAKDGPIIAAAWKPVTTPSAEPARLF